MPDNFVFDDCATVSELPSVWGTCDELIAESVGCCDSLLPQAETDKSIVSAIKIVSVFFIVLFLL
ncbi:hypothetical protein DXD93_10335 [Ruminococcus bromii]|nr:hypothetical protein DXD93_10335 [Ruminococcus bromii]